MLSFFIFNYKTTTLFLIYFKKILIQETMKITFFLLFLYKCLNIENRLKMKKKKDVNEPNYLKACHI